MKEGDASFRGNLNKLPKNMPFLYLLFILLLIFLWQAAVGQYAVRVIPYSDFKQALKNGEVAECLVRDDSIEGKIQPKTAPSTEAVPPPSPSGKTVKENNPPAAAKAYLFRTVRIEDPKLVDELQRAGVKFTGVRGSLMSLLLWWVLPLGALFIFWSLIGRRLGRAGESILT